MISEHDKSEAANSSNLSRCSEKSEQPECFSDYFSKSESEKENKESKEKLVSSSNSSKKRRRASPAQSNEDIYKIVSEQIAAVEKNGLIQLSPQQKFIPLPMTAKKCSSAPAHKALS